VIQVACVVIEYDGKIAIAKRGDGRDKGLWEFPGGKKLTNETILECAVREIKEELNVDITALNVLLSLEHSTESHKKLLLHYVRAEASDWTPTLSEHSEVCLVSIKDLIKFNFTAADEHFSNWLMVNIHRYKPIHPRT